MSGQGHHQAHRDAPTCRELVGHLSAYLDGELEPRLLSQVELHLDGCSDCRACASEIRATIRLIRERAYLPVSPRERDRIRNRLWSALDGGTKGGRPDVQGR
jgi:anti-sigma factor RsiW